MRIALNTRAAALFGALMLAGLMVTVPLRLALQWFGADQLVLTARVATGPVWWGRLQDARLGGVALGDIAAGLSPFDLLLGRARFWLRGADADGLRGSLVVSRHSVGAEGLSGSFATGERFAPLPVARVEASGVTVRFVDGACDRAEGQLRVLLETDTPGLPLPAAMSGPLRCAGTAVLANLTAPSGGSGIDLRVEQSGRYTATVRLGAGASASPAALGAGFRPGPRGLVLPVSGQF